MSNWAASAMAEGWKFTERSYEVRYFDPTPLLGSPEVGWEMTDSSQA